MTGAGLGIQRHTQQTHLLTPCHVKERKKEILYTGVIKTLSDQAGVYSVICLDASVNKKPIKIFFKNIFYLEYYQLSKILQFKKIIFVQH